MQVQDIVMTTKQVQDTCPICGTEIVSSCKCHRRHGKCQNGHAVAYCTIHDIYKFLPQSLEVHILPSRSCICAAIKMFESFHSLVEYWEKQLAEKGVQPYEVLSISYREEFIDLDPDLALPGRKMKGVYVRDIHHPRDDILLTDGCTHDMFELDIIQMRCGLEVIGVNSSGYAQDFNKWKTERAEWLQDKTVTINVKHYEALLQSQKILSTIEKKLEQIQKLAEGLKNEHNKRPRLDDVQ